MYATWKAPKDNLGVQEGQALQRSCSSTWGIIVTPDHARKPLPMTNTFDPTNALDPAVQGYVQNFLEMWRGELLEINKYALLPGIEVTTMETGGLQYIREDPGTGEVLSPCPVLSVSLKVNMVNPSDLTLKVQVPYKENIEVYLSTTSQGYLSSAELTPVLSCLMAQVEKAVEEKSQLLDGNPLAAMIAIRGFDLAQSLANSDEFGCGGEDCCAGDCEGCPNGCDPDDGECRSKCH